MGDLFDAAPMYDEDYLYFFAAPGGLSEFARHGPNVPGANVPGEAAAELAWRLLDLQPGMRVLDLACGHGDLANRLAARGCLVTGLDSSPVGFPELRGWLLATGFTTVAGYGEDGRPLTAGHKRMVIVADRP
jgi:SAM-dependent methyltransferase